MLAEKIVCSLHLTNRDARTTFWLLPVVLLGVRLFLAVACPNTLEKWKKSYIESLVTDHKIF